jgi:DNA-binding beta-propeller fold protein YncE
VFVSGGSKGPTTGSDYLTVAYNAATGRQLWASRYNGPSDKNDGATAVAVSPAGTEVFVTGHSQGRTTDYDYATAAYSAATGRQLWARRYPGYNGASAMAVSPARAIVYVTGSGSGSGGLHGGYATIAYSAATGRQLWASRYNGSGLDQTPSMAVSPGEPRVFVSGLSGNDYATIAYQG